MTLRKQQSSIVYFVLHNNLILNEYQYYLNNLLTLII